MIVPFTVLDKGKYFCKSIHCPCLHALDELEGVAVAEALHLPAGEGPHGRGEREVRGPPVQLAQVEGVAVAVPPGRCHVDSVTPHLVDKNYLDKWLF